MARIFYDRRGRILNVRRVLYDKSDNWRIIEIIAMKRGYEQHFKEGQFHVVETGPLGQRDTMLKREDTIKK